MEVKLDLQRLICDASSRTLVRGRQRLEEALEASTRACVLEISNGIDGNGQQVQSGICF